MTPFDTYRAIYDRAIAGEEFPYPIHVEIENIYACNLACVHCAREYVQADANKVLKMDDALYEKVVTEAAVLGTRSLGFAVWGEVFIDKTIFDKIAFAKRQGILDIRLHSNGILIDERMASRILAAGVTWLGISLDAVTPETYAKVRGGDFEKAKQAVSHLLAAKTFTNSAIPHLRVSFVKCSLNEHEVEAFTKQWSPYCEVVIQDFYDASNILPAHLQSKDGPSLRPTQCFENFYKVFVRHDGTVVPCCEDIQNTIVLGNVAQTTLAAIYNGPVAKDLRRQHATKQITNPTCRGCLAV